MSRNDWTKTSARKHLEPERFKGKYNTLVNCITSVKVPKHIIDPMSVFYGSLAGFPGHHIHDGPFLAQQWHHHGSMCGSRIPPTALLGSGELVQVVKYNDNYLIYRRPCRHRVRAGVLDVSPDSPRDCRRVPEARPDKETLAQQHCKNTHTHISVMSELDWKHQHHRAV